MPKRSPFRFFQTNPEVIRLAVMLCIRFPLSLRNVEDLLHERGIGVSHESVRFWQQRFGPKFAAKIRRKPVKHMRGYTGNFSNLERLLAAWRRAERPATCDPTPTPPHLKPVRDPHTRHVISPVIAAALCIKPRGSLTGEQARKVDALKTGSHAFATMRSLAMRFKGILRGGRSDPLDTWIDDALDSNLIPIMRLARVLHRDIDAVYDAIELPWSNGQPEDQINRLKIPKRAMYGRAGPERLRTPKYAASGQLGQPAMFLEVQLH